MKEAENSLNETNETWSICVYMHSSSVNPNTQEASLQHSLMHWPRRIPSVRRAARASAKALFPRLRR